jgi:Zn-dependent peptidase ImmA (M78 family)/transcriptional regulator with XRE-family HTH domain
MYFCENPSTMSENKSDQLLAEIYSLLGQNSSVDIAALLDKRMNDLDLSERQLSSILSIERPSLKRLREGETQKVDLLTALKLIQFLGLEIDEFIKMYVSALPKESISSLEKVRKANYLVETFDLKTLKKIGFISSTTDYEEIEKRIITQFGLTSIFEYSLEIAYPLFSRGKRPFADKMLEYWVKSAYAKFLEINNTNKFDKIGLESLIPKIRPYSRDIEFGMLTVIKALYNLGITVIVQPYLMKTHIYGMTMIVNNKPCIALSNYYNKYPTLWFTLLHEIAHVFYHLDKIATLGYHISGNDDLYLMEPEANLFAREILFAEDKVNYIKAFIDNYRVVEKYAEENKVHPSIIYGIYIRSMEDINPGVDYSWLYAKYSSYINISPESTIKSVSTSAWGECNIKEDSERVKQAFINALK